MAEEIRIVLPDDSVTARAYPAAASGGVTLILGHGAGASQSSPFMVAIATALAERGIDVVTFNFSYTEHGRKVPDANDRLEACWAAVFARIRGDARLGRGAVAIGGKSMGGRIATQVAAKGTAKPDAIVCLGYPLHPAGKPQQLRVRHLAAINQPILFVQGTRDALGTPEELRPHIAELRGAEVYVVAGGDHSFKVLKREGGKQSETDAAIRDEIARFLRDRLIAP